MDAATVEEKVISDFERIIQAVRIKMLDHHHAKHIWGLVDEMRKISRNLISDWPDFDKDQVWQSRIKIGVLVLSLYTASIRQDFTIVEINHLIKDFLQAYLNSIPRIYRATYKWYFFSPINKNYLRKGAYKSHKQRFEIGWLYKYIDAEVVDFNIGIDIHECAIQKFYKTHNAESLTSYMCDFEDKYDQLLGLGLKRTGTLVDRASCCAFRWRWGCKTPT